MEENNNLNIEKEMEDPYEEVYDTLPDEEKAEPQKEDYLDTYKTKKSIPFNPSAPVMFNDNAKNENLVIWQLRVDWDRIEHVLRGHKPKVDDDGNEYFVKIDDHYLNDYGVNMILHFLSGYLSKEIFLARFSADKVTLNMKQFSRIFIHFFYDNIVEFGMDTPKKKKVAPMFVQMIIDLVEASYSRAIEGKQAELINKQFSVMQNQPLQPEFSPEDYKPKRGNIIQRIFS